MKKILMGVIGACFALFLVACSNTSTLTEQSAASAFKVAEEIGMKRASEADTSNYESINGFKHAIVYVKGDDLASSTGGLFFVQGDDNAEQELLKTFGQATEKRGNFNVYQQTMGNVVQYGVHDTTNNNVLYFAGFTEEFTPEQWQKIKTELDKFK